MKAVGLDFETANPYPGSICEAGLALVEDGVIVDRREWLIRPHETLEWFPESFTAIHGITFENVRDKPEFYEVWDEMAEFIKRGEFVVCHNAPFDLRQLKAALTLYGLSSITFPYRCSLQMSRRAFPDLPSHKLDAVARYLGFTFRHHDALEDAAACAIIAEKIGEVKNCKKTFTFALPVTAP